MSDRRRIYEAYLLSAHWANLRGQSFAIAGGRCEACYSKEKLVGHHITYREPLESCTPEDIMCLCAPCHDGLHAWLDETKKKPWYFSREATVDKIREMQACKPKAKKKEAAPKSVAPEFEEWMKELTAAEIADYRHFFAKSPAGNSKQRHNYALKRVQKIHKRQLKHLRYSGKKLAPTESMRAVPSQPGESLEHRLAKVEAIAQRYAERIAHLEQEIHLLKNAA